MQYVRDPRRYFACLLMCFTAKIKLYQLLRNQDTSLVNTQNNNAVYSAIDILLISQFVKKKISLVQHFRVSKVSKVQNFLKF